MDERREHHIEFVEAREDSPKALEPTKQPLNLVAAAIHELIIFPGAATSLEGWHDGCKPKSQDQLACVVPLIRSVHDHGDQGFGWIQGAQQPASFRGIMALAWGEREGDGCSSICGNHMNLGGPSSSGLSDGLRSVFFNAPVPSG